MTYARIENGLVAEYPVYEGEIKLRFSNVSFAEPFVAPEGYELVENAQRPNVDYTKNVSLGTPIKIKGIFTQVWDVTSASENEIVERVKIQWTSIRTERNNKLADCDWTQLPDAPVDGAAWAEYRQELRDITTQTDPFNITWPQEPG